jgi:hypothetical protein
VKASTKTESDSVTRPQKNATSAVMFFHLSALPLRMAM